MITADEAWARMTRAQEAMDKWYRLYTEELRREATKIIRAAHLRTGELIKFKEATAIIDALPRGSYPRLGLYIDEYKFARDEVKVNRDLWQALSANDG